MKNEYTQIILGEFHVPLINKRSNNFFNIYKTIINLIKGNIFFGQINVMFFVFISFIFHIFKYSSVRLFLKGQSVLCSYPFIIKIGKSSALLYLSLLTKNKFL